MKLVSAYNVELCREIIMLLCDEDNPYDFIPDRYSVTHTFKNFPQEHCLLFRIYAIYIRFG